MKRCWLVATLLLADWAPGAFAEAPLEFNRDIRPILSENCFRCHGPDHRKREAGLRLDVEQGAKSPLESGATAIAPGQPAASALVARITSTDPDEVMPPPDSGKSLTAAQVDTLRRWIEAGAPYEDHWSFLPIRRPSPPAVDGAWIRSPLDAFVMAKLREHGLAPSADADRITLIRRLSQDLLGLPPAPEDVESFLAATDPQAYEDLVARLLGSPHYGERMAIFWLDLVRYADSVGYHGDQAISVSPFRDWVIRAFNDNLRFDRFTIEQLAGDLLPQPTREQRIASGYNRLGMMSAEGGVQDKEYRAKYAAERVRNLSGTWLGVTLGCCECHDHKYDPFTSRDFYSLQAFFADINEKGFYDGGFSRNDWGPSLPVPTGEQQTRLAELEAEIARLRAAYDSPTPELAAALAAWEATVAGSADWRPLHPDVASSAGGATLTVLADDSVLASGANPDQDVYTLEFAAPIGGATALRVEVLPDDSLPQRGPGRADNGNFVLGEIKVAVQPGPDAPPQPVALQNATATIEQTASAEGNPYKAWTAAAAIDGDVHGAQWGWAILDEAGQANDAVFETAAPLAVASPGRLSIVLEQNLPNPRHTLGRFRISVTSAPQPVRALGAGLPRKVRDALAVPAADRSDSQRHELLTYYRTIAPLLAPVREQLAAAEKARQELSDAITTSPVTAAVPPRMIRLLKRGNWMDDSGEEVQPRVPAHLWQPASTAERLTRLDLARWLVARDNPLVARVFVNRLWKMFFGAGLSRKLEDVGAQGDWPSHPELLDWLAGQLIDSGWDVKHVVRLMVTSATYRQSSLAGAELREKDPFNRWLARQGRFRLDAELVRDGALAASGLLVPAVGGRSVKPYQPPGYWAHLNFPTREWQNGTGDELYRRGLYTHWQRQYLHPSLVAFDAPSREECTADRVRSNTPLQALVLLNDPAFVEAARVLAEGAAQRGAAPEARVTWAFRRVLSREPRDAERDVLVRLYEQHLADFRADPAAAQELLGIGARPAAALDPAELAALTSVARALLNLHETITRN